VRLKGSTFSLGVIAADSAAVRVLRARSGDHAGTVHLLAYCLDPLVELLERVRIPRTIGAMATVLLLCAVLVALGYAMWTRTSDFVDDWPKYEAVIKKAASAVEARISRIEGQVSEIGPAPAPE